MSEHIIPARVYYVIFAILMVCTYLTWQIAYFDLGAFNSVAALAIAIFKAVLVILFFMHVKYSPRLTWVVVIGGVFWLGILLTLTMGDYLTRGWRTEQDDDRCCWPRCWPPSRRRPGPSSRRHLTPVYRSGSRCVATAFPT